MKQTIEGKTLQGEARKYTLNLLNTRESLRVCHNNLPSVMDAWSRVQSSEWPELVMLVGNSFEWSDMEDMAKAMLANAEVEIDGANFTLDENGMGEFMTGDPPEFYTALLYALLANYPKYLKPFFDQVGGKDTSQKPAPSKSE